MATSSDGQVVPTTVRVRFRPRNKREQGGTCVQLDQNSIAFKGAEGQGSADFQFDKVYGENSTQAEVFQDLAFVVEASLKGFNGAVLAYGQTGAGKTHTLFGAVTDPEQQGVVPRAIAHLGQGISGALSQGQAIFKVSLSVVEIYCERIRCLLDASGRDNLQVKTDPVRGVYVEGATEVEVCGEEELEALMTAGLASRSVAATNMNAESSRSHCVVTIFVERSLPSGEAQLGKLVLVDLAGSERAGKTGAAGTTLAEGALINKSLSCLANVIHALTDTSTSSAPRHVPYRDSKLTRMLQDSLGGTARTVLICCASPIADNAAETLSTLRFGARAKGLQCKIQVNQRLSAERLQQLLTAERSQRAGLDAQVKQLRAALAAAGIEVPQLVPLAAPGSAAGSQGAQGTSSENRLTAETKPPIETASNLQHAVRATWIADFIFAFVMVISVVGFFVVEDMMLRS